MDKTNNNIWNLIPMTKAEHTTYHNQFQEYSDEMRTKISKIHKGKTISDEQRQLLSELNKGENNNMYGKHHSKESKQKISDKTRQFGFCGQNVYFKRSHFNENNPNKCFEMRYNRKTLPIGWFNEWISCEIILGLIEEEIT